MQVAGAKGKSEWDNLEKNQTNQNSTALEQISICDIWKDNTHKLVKKTEYQTPIFLQTYAQIHTEFLHSIDTIFGTCYLWQKKYFDKIGMDKPTIIEYGKWCDAIINETTLAMDAFVKNCQMQSDLTVNMMKTGNNTIRQWLDWQAKMMSILNP